MFFRKLLLIIIIDTYSWRFSSYFDKLIFIKLIFSWLLATLFPHSFQSSHISKFFVFSAVSESFEGIVCILSRLSVIFSCYVPFPFAQLKRVPFILICAELFVQLKNSIFHCITLQLETVHIKWHRIGLKSEERSSYFT